MANVEHFLARPGLLETPNATELAARQLRLNLGFRRSGARGSGLLLLSQLGMEIDEEDLYFMGADDSVKALLSNSVDLITVPVGCRWQRLPSLSAVPRSGPDHQL